MSEIKTGALLSYLNLFLTNIIGIFMTPYIIGHLGNKEYGLYLLIGSLVSYITVLDLGLDNATVRYVSLYRAQNDKLSEQKFLSSTFIAYCFISLAVIILGCILYYRLDYFFGKTLSSQELVRARKMFAILIFDLALAFPGGIFTAICNAYQRYVFPRLMMNIRYIIRTGALVLLLKTYANSLTIVWLDTLLNIISIILASVFVAQNLKISVFRKFRMDRRLIRETLSYSVWVFVYAVTSQLLGSCNQTVLGMNVGPAAVAVFGVGIMLSGYYGGLAAVVNAMLLPTATRLFAGDADARLYTDTMIRVGRFNSAAMFLILGGFLLVGREFVLLWLGRDYGPSWWFALLLMLSTTLAFVQGFGNSILEAKRKNRFRSLLYLATATICCIAGYFVSKKMGLKGMVYPLAIVNVVNSAVMLFYFFLVFGLNIMQFLRSVFAKQAVLTALLVAMGFTAKKFFRINDWAGLIFYAAGFSLLYATAFYLFVFTPSEKALIGRK